MGFSKIISIFKCSSIVGIERRRRFGWILISSREHPDDSRLSGNFTKTKGSSILPILSFLIYDHFSNNRIGEASADFAGDNGVRRVIGLWIGLHRECRRFVFVILSDFHETAHTHCADPGKSSIRRLLHAPPEQIPCVLQWTERQAADRSIWSGEKARRHLARCLIPFFSCNRAGEILGRIERHRLRHSVYC